MTTWFRQIESPVGPLVVAASDAGLHLVEFHAPRHTAPRRGDWRSGEHPVLDAAASQLAEYFAGARQQFDLPLAPTGTAFQQQVWHTLATIPYGRTISYAELARRIERPGASRAVGAANGRNPLPIVLPCHRVIGASGALTGFGGGLPVKRFLLDLEASTVGELLPCR